ILVYMCRFLANHDALKQWLFHALDDDSVKNATSYDILKNSIPSIDEFLRSVQQWLERYKTDVVDQDMVDCADDWEDASEEDWEDASEEEILAKALKTRQRLLNDANLLQNYLGRFAAAQAFYTLFQSHYIGIQIERSFAYGAYRYWQVKSERGR